MFNVIRDDEKIFPLTIILENYHELTVVREALSNFWRPPKETALDQVDLKSTAKLFTAQLAGITGYGKQ